VKLFEAILMKDIGWFDAKDKAPGVLTNIIQEDITALNGLTTEAAGIMVEAVLGMTISAGICLFFSWQLALVVTAVSPFMILGGLGMSKLQFNQ
jgi:ATP-binding cassette subfamily B (MDR/TAP) protein 1